MELTNKITTTQPQATIQMSVVNPAPENDAQNPQEINHAKRIRGGHTAVAYARRALAVVVHASRRGAVRASSLCSVRRITISPSASSVANKE
ncbi:hypothetical protein PAXINDRAFT_18284 [Paxillus involutus ATCC 200175]|uniref:Uncharacterized protein n=1 Tax=Paxillus involutus ATCC 200175 TaxID=664439 RepID=A0A0C9TLH9_PAXIN|nr:hypothetical protein PAXINDRAFT_18284 [Paxillus involutus ATCC 200175]